MKQCHWCLESKTEDDYYTYKKNVCKGCMVEYNSRYKIAITTFKPAKTYMDYVREAGLSDYYRKSMKYRL